MAERVKLANSDLMFTVDKLYYDGGEGIAVGTEENCSYFTKVTLTLIKRDQDEKLQELKEALTRALEILE